MGQAIRWQWVKGHNGNLWNEVAVRLCGQSASGGADDLAEMELEWAEMAWQRFEAF